MVDHYSDYIELDSFSRNTTANTVIRAMKRQFTRHGIPDELIADNGKSAINESHEYLIFAQEYGFHSQIISLLQPGKWEMENWKLPRIS